jgi:N-methylhydantoinase A
VRETAPKLGQLLKQARPMVDRALAELTSQGAPPSTIKTDLRADVRYRGQSYEIEVELGAKFVAEFHQAHQRTFGYAAPDSPIEVVNIRLRASAAGPPLEPTRIARVKSKPVSSSTMNVIVGALRRRVPVYARDAIGANARIAGPAIVVELSATAYVAPEFTLRCDDFGNLHLETSP